MRTNVQPEFLESAQHLGWLAGESLFSLASRHHVLSGNWRAACTARQLFGHDRGGYPHDLPAGLDYFAQVLGSRLGTADDIALQRTCLPLLLAFRDDCDRSNALAAMRSPRIGALKSKLGLPAGGFGAMGLLKACRTCMASDAAAHGVAYWHVEHQLPGVWLCLQHDELLHFSLSKRVGQGRFDWILPRIADLQPSVASDAARNAEFRGAVRRMAAVAAAANKASQASSVDSTTYGKAIHAILMDSGLALCSGQIRSRAVSKMLEDFVGLLAVLPEWTECDLSGGRTYSWLHRAIHRPDSGHVLRPLALVAMLCGSWEHFLRRCHAVPRSEVDVQPHAVRKVAHDHRDRLIHLVRENGRSVTAAATEVGVSVAAAQSWVAAAGALPPKRPSKIRGPVLVKILLMLRDGEEVGQIAAIVHISEVSIRRLARTTPGLLSEWRRAREARLRSEVRSRWLSALQFSAVAGPGAARTVEPSAYAWLYRNDRQWLMDNNSNAYLERAGNNARTDWDKRDRELSEACGRAVLEITDGSSSHRITLVDICKLVPELRTKLCHIDRLPLTARILSASMSARCRDRLRKPDNLNIRSALV